MLKASQKPNAGFDGHIHFRAPSDLMPAIHAFARRRGLTSASWLRSVIIDALDRDGGSSRQEDGA